MVLPLIFMMCPHWVGRRLGMSAAARFVEGTLAMTAESQ
jgi:hypothetical protein